MPMLRVWTSATGRVSAYCGRGHARLARRPNVHIYECLRTRTTTSRLNSGPAYDELHDKSSAKPGHEGPKSAGKRNQASSRPHSSRRVAFNDASSLRRSIKHSGHPSYEYENKKLVTAYCVATHYNFSDLQILLRRRGFVIDPCHTTLSRQVIHIELPTSKDIDEPLRPTPKDAYDKGDVFIFPSGTVVAWDVPPASVLRLIQEVLWAAGEGHHSVEDEDFEYVEDPGRERSSIQGETIVLGTRVKNSDDGHDHGSPHFPHHQRSGSSSSSSTSTTADQKNPNDPSSSSHRHVSVVLSKIAFSAGLARSTKLAVLEARLDTYLEGTKTIPEKFMSGQFVSFSRAFIYLKMGQLLDLRRQLNLSSDITDSLPDVFWDTGADLGLEGYYNGMSGALDTRQRIVILNEKIGYAHEIASVLREELSAIREQRNERRSLRLEWIIILLIAVEVLFGSWDLYQKELKRKRRETAGSGSGE